MALIKCPECSTEVSENAPQCVKCGYPIKDIIKCPDCGTYNAGKPAACARCGAPFKAAVAGTASPATKSEDSGFGPFGTVSSTWAWMLAFLPIFTMIIGWILELIIYGDVTDDDNFWIYNVIFYCLCVLFWILDGKELSKNGYGLGIWAYIGSLLLTPILYLFLRAAKTNRKYGYAIAACVVTASLIIIWIVAIAEQW